MNAINTDKAPEAIGSYSQAMRVGNTVYLSGQIGLDPLTMLLISEDVGAQINQVIKNMHEVCLACGGDLANLVKVSVFLTDISNFSLVNAAMEKFFSKPYPARSLIEVAGLPKGAKVEMDAIMILPSSSL